MEENNEKPETAAACSKSDEEDDRLSNLSDELILHILSFLSTKESYRTSVLSKRWELICTKIPNLDFELLEVSDPTSSKSIQSVYAALLRRTENIRKLSLLSNNGCQSYDVHLWVSKALDLNVQELDVECWHLDKPTLLPLRLSMSKSLVVLKFRGETQPRLNSSSVVNFPSLKVLHIQCTMLNSIMDDHSEYDLSNFLACCPQLEELLLHDCFKQPINISFHSLKRLYLYLIMPVPDSNIGPLQINAPSLEVLSIVDSSLTPRKYELINLSNLDRATLHISKHPDFNSLYTLLKGFSNVKSLTISSETIHFLSMEEDILDSLHLLTFHNLVFLSVEISENCSWNILFSFLQNAPKLAYLAIEKNFKTEEVGNSGWVGPSETPTCLSKSLITFEFNGIQNIQTDLDFTRYIINHSSKLEEVKICTPSSYNPVERSLLEGSKESSVLVWVVVLPRVLIVCCLRENVNGDEQFRSWTCNEVQILETTGVWISIQFEDYLDVFKDSIKTTPHC